jgi:hypothetical protein
MSGQLCGNMVISLNYFNHVRFMRARAVRIGINQKIQAQSELLVTKYSFSRPNVDATMQI